MDSNLYLILFTLGSLCALISLISIILCFCESYLQSQRRTSAKIHPDKNETIKNNYIDKINLNPMFVTVN
jgi:hypothetical protein